MQDERAFRETYLALLALIWDALERIGAQLGSHTPHGDQAIEIALQCLRLELLQLHDSAGRCAAAGQLSGRQEGRMRRLVMIQMDWLDFDAGTTREVIRLRAVAAQNWLFDEALAETSGRRDGPQPHGPVLLAIVQDDRIAAT